MGKRERKGKRILLLLLMPEQISHLLLLPTPKGRHQWLIAPGTQGVTSGVTAVWLFLCPVPLFCVLGSISSLMPREHLQLLHAFANWINQSISVGQRRPCPTSVLRNRQKHFLKLIPSKLKEREKRGGRNRRREGERGKTNIKRF